MNLAEKLNQESLSIEERQNKIANEIVAYFQDIFESGKFAIQLEEYIGTQEKAQRKYTMDVEFWRYTSGCSSTHFQVFIFRWNNPEGEYYDSFKYKGIDLNNIQRDVGKRLLNLTEYHLKDMGFNVLVEDKESWLKNYHKRITITW